MDSDIETRSRRRHMSVGHTSKPSNVLELREPDLSTDDENVEKNTEYRDNPGCPDDDESQLTEHPPVSNEGDEARISDHDRSGTSHSHGNSRRDTYHRMNKRRRVISLQPMEGDTDENEEDPAAQGDGVGHQTGETVTLHAVQNTMKGMLQSFAAEMREWVSQHSAVNQQEPPQGDRPRQPDATFGVATNDRYHSPEPRVVNYNNQRSPPRARHRERINFLSRRRRRYSSSEGDMGSDEELSLSETVGGNLRQRVRRSYSSSPKLPPFTGKESWLIWMNRFSDIAYRQQWSDDRKLDELLPRLQGQAGEFVFGQLSPQVRSSYTMLTDELTNRFRVVATEKTYSAKFSKRSQEPGESVESYAAELKRLYDKAHPLRDRQTRKEDLLRRFLDGLSDGKARFHVEYVKDPNDIDEAVFEVVHFLETQYHSKSGHDGVNRHNRNARMTPSTSNDDSSEDEVTKETHKPARIGKIKPGRSAHKILKTTDENQTDVKKAEMGTNAAMTGDNKSDLQEVKELLLKLVGTNQQSTPPQRNGPRAGCYNCNGPHYARECPNYRMPQNVHNTQARPNNYTDQRRQYPVRQNLPVQRPPTQGNYRPGGIFNQRRQDDDTRSPPPIHHQESRPSMPPHPQPLN